MSPQTPLSPPTTDATEAAPKRSSLTPPLAVFLVGIALSVALFAVFTRQAHHAELDKVYQEEALPLSAALGRTIETSLDSVASISGLYAASNSVDRGEFRAYVEQLLERNNELQAVEWVPRVAAADRTTYEAAARRDGLAEFRITERNSTGEMVPAAARPEYFPIFFLEPLNGNEAALGFDLGSDQPASTRLTALVTPAKS